MFTVVETMWGLAEPPKAPNILLLFRVSFWKGFLYVTQVRNSRLPRVEESDKELIIHGLSNITCFHNHLDPMDLE